MDFVPGMTLEEFAEVENPSARMSARIILETALTLGEVHVQGVFHRDLKPENIIIQGKNERPVLIDFGVGTYAGAPVMTPFGLPPGTYEFRAPEASLFNRSNPEPNVTVQEGDTTLHLSGDWDVRAVSSFE